MLIDRMLVAPKLQRQIFKATRDHVRTWCGQQQNVCLYWAYFGQLELIRHGLRPSIQAGSVYWLRVPEEKWKAGHPTSHFSMVWTAPTARTGSVFFDAGILPEMHVWLGICGTRKCRVLPQYQQEMVDLTSGVAPDMCRAMGMEWTGPEPPRFLWGRPLDIDCCRWRHVPELSAIKYVARCIEQLCKQGRLPSVQDVLGSKPGKLVRPTK